MKMSEFVLLFPIINIIGNSTPSFYGVYDVVITYQLYDWWDLLACSEHVQDKILSLKVNVGL